MPPMIMYSAISSICDGSIPSGAARRRAKTMLTTKASSKNNPNDEMGNGPIWNKIGFIDHPGSAVQLREQAECDAGVVDVREAEDGRQQDNAASQRQRPDDQRLQGLVDGDHAGHQEDDSCAGAR